MVFFVHQIMRVNPPQGINQKNLRKHVSVNTIPISFFILPEIASRVRSFSMQNGVNISAANLHMPRRFSR